MGFFQIPHSTARAWPGKEITVSEVKRFRADHRHVVETEFDDAQFVDVADFGRVTAERDALQAAADRSG